jgi:hypothetical protein
VAPLFKLTFKDSGYKGGLLPKDAMTSFSTLKNQLTQEPVMAFPSSDWKYTFITYASTGTTDLPRGLGAILTQVDQLENFYAISFASR